MKTAFVAIDVQGAWAEQNPRTTHAIKEAADLARLTMPVIWVYYKSRGVDICIAANERDRYYNVFNQVSLNYDDAVPGIEPHPQDRILTKSDFSLFSNPAGARYFKDNNIARLVFAGFETSKCVYHSAAEAVQAGFIAEAAIDLMADHQDRNFSGAQSRLEEQGVKAVLAAGSGLQFIRP